MLFRSKSQTQQQESETSDVQLKIAPHQPKYSQEVITKAIHGHYYIKIGTSPGQLSITGAERHWKKQASSEVPEEERDIYVPDCRVVGSFDAICKFLEDNGRNIDDMDYYTFENTRQGGEMKKRYDEEIDDRKHSKETKKVVSNFDLSELPLIMKHTTNAKLSKRCGKSNRNLESPEDQMNHLNSRVQDAVNKGKVLNVSNYNFSTGTGAKVVDVPKGRTVKSAQIGRASCRERV